MSAPDEAAVGLVRGVELFHLGDRRPAAAARQAPDQLDVAEVAGGQRVELAAAEETEALHRPGADLGHRQQAAVGAPDRRSGSGRRRPRGRPAAAPAPVCRPGPSLESRPGRGRRSPPARGRRARRLAPLAEPRPPAADDAALDQRRPLGLDQLADDRRRQRLPGPRPPAGGSPASGGSAARPAGRGGSGDGSRARSSSTPSAKRIRSIASSSCVAPGRPRARRHRDRRPRDPLRLDRLGPQPDPVAQPAARPGPAPGCRRRAGAASRPRPGPAASGPRCRAAAGRARAAGPRLRAPQRRAGGRRPGRSGWRRRSGDRGGARRAGAARVARADGAGHRPHRGDGRGPGEDAAGGGDRGGPHLGPQHRQRRGRIRLVARGQRPHRVGGVGRAGVFFGHDLAVYVELTHPGDSSAARGRSRRGIARKDGTS